MTRHIVINNQQFTLAGVTTRGGAVLQETYFASDNTKVTIDYTYTEKGSK